MTPSELAASIRLRTRANSTTLTDADILIWANDRILDFGKAIQDADEDGVTVSKSYDLVVSTAFANRKYSLDANILSRIKRVEAAPDGTNMFKVEEMPFANIDHALTETEIANRYSNLEFQSRFYLTQTQLVLLSGTVTAGTDTLKVWFDTYMNPLANVTESSTDMSANTSEYVLGLPKPLHTLLVKAIVIDWKESREKPIALSQTEQSFRQDLQDAVNTLKHAYENRDIIGTMPSGYDRGDNGFNY